MDQFLSLLYEANRIVLSTFPGCEFYEATGNPASGTGSQPQDVTQWQFAFNHPLTAGSRHTVYLYYRDAQFDAPEDHAFFLMGDVAVPLPIALGLAEAVMLKERAGYADPFSLVQLNWAVAPLVKEPHYIFTIPSRASYVFVGVYSKAVTSQPISQPKRSSDQTPGVIVYDIRDDGTLRGRWVVEAPRVAGTEFAWGGTSGQLPGRYQVEIYDDKENTIFRGELVITDSGDVYDLAWTGVLVPSEAPAAFQGVGLVADRRLTAAWWRAHTLQAADEAPRVLPANSIRELMQVSAPGRDVVWLRRALQFAVELEWFTIPPYLTAMWSIIQPPDKPPNKVRQFLSQIVQTEMLHFGFACNLLTTIGGMPVIASARVAPKYPGVMPGGVHPGLLVRLQAMSKCVVEHVFMKIEEPEFAPVTTYRGEEFPTIGAFYSAIAEVFERIEAKEITGRHQIEYTPNEFFRLTAVRTREDALAAIRLIKEQGEGTTSSPYFGPSPVDVAHYYRFGEMLCERRLARDCLGHWSFTGPVLPFPRPHEIYPMAAVPPGGYEESKDFDVAYTKILYKLESAWRRGGAAGSQLLGEAVDNMPKLYCLAKKLLDTKLPNEDELRFAPSFRFRER